MNDKDELSLIELERRLQAKYKHLAALQRRRARLQRHLSVIENEIAEMGGEAAMRKLGGRVFIRHRPKNQKSLRAFVEETLAKNKKGLSLKDISERVLTAGYQTNSQKFKNTLYQCVYHAENIQKDGKTGLWKLG